jgi:hypothetical protein
LHCAHSVVPRSAGFAQIAQRMDDDSLGSVAIAMSVVRILPAWVEGMPLA